MQKKIIALAVAGLVSGAAFAQSNVTIYGVADMSYVYADDFAGTSAAAKNTDAIHKIYSGGQSGSRLGFKGMEDLGNGLMATFRFESGINLDNGGAAQNGGTFSRWSTVGLSGKNWGEIEIGRRDTISDQLIGGFDVTTRSTVAQASPIMKDVGRWDNAVTYSSPVWSGFQLKGQFSTNVSDGQAKAPTGANYSSEISAAPIPSTCDAKGLPVSGGTLPCLNNDLRYSNVYGYAVSATYVNGGLKLGGHYDKYDPQDVDGSNFETADQWTVAASYNFGFVNVGAQYGEISYGQNASGLVGAGYTSTALDQRTQWTVGAMFKISDRARASLMYAEGTDEFVTAGLKDQDNSMWGVAAYYDLSKRTNLYAAYGQVDQDDDAHAVLVGLDGQDKYQKGFQVGIRHLF